MALIEQRLAQLGLRLPAQIQPPLGVTLPFAFVQIQGTRVLFSGHGPLNDDGSVAEPLGRLGQDLTVEQAAGRRGGWRCRSWGAWRGRSAAWTRVFGMVNCTPDFAAWPPVINGFSHLLLELYGEDRGMHSAVGMAALPFNIPVELEREVLLHG